MIQAPRIQAAWAVRVLFWSTLLPCAGCGELVDVITQTASWRRHVIDDGRRGADGVKLGDVNGDGRSDLVVPWEESGVVVVYVNGGPAVNDAPWPAIVVGEVGDVEDAVFVDLDDDGALDVVSCSEGDTAAVHVHWNPGAGSGGNTAAWESEVVPASLGRQWMFCEPAQIDGTNGVDLVAGGKGDGAQVGYFSSPADARDLSAWRWRPLASVQWTMSIVPRDVDGDGDIDVVHTDRKGDGRGCYWLENPGAATVTAAWSPHTIGTSDNEVMFLDLCDLDADGALDAVAATASRRAIWWAATSDLHTAWVPAGIVWTDSFGSGKGVRCGDLNLDGLTDIAFSCENAAGRIGVGYLAQSAAGNLVLWTPVAIADTAGGKFDLVQLLDLDADGDLDVITTEESAQLGVVWYENPVVP